MADLPQHHHFTRWWLRRYPAKPYGVVNRIVLFDRALAEDVGADMRYPEELNTAMVHLRQLRARDAEPLDEFVFCDGHGNL